MKKILLAVFVLSAAYNLFSQSWNTVLEPDIKNSIIDVYFIDANEGYLVGDNSLVLHTTDGGITFVQQTLPSVKSLRKVYFADKQNGWIGSNEGGLYYTVNGGATWNEFNLTGLIYPQTAITYFDGLCFVTPKIGFALAGKSKAYYLFKTTDGGVSWAIKDSLVSSTAQRWYSIDFYNENVGVVVGDKYNIQKYTTDGGNTWSFSTAVSASFFGILKSVKFLSAKDVIAVGEGSEFNGLITPIYKSTDGGINWVKKTQSVTNYDRAKDSYFKNANEGIAVGSNGFSKMYYTKTTDGGETWTPYAGGFDGGLQAVSGSGNVLYALGTSSHLVKSTDFGSTWTMIPYKTPSVFYGLQFIGSKGFAMNNYGDFFVNDNGLGDSWKYVTSTGIWDSYAMTFTSDKVGFILKENSHIVKTTDGGSTWKSVLGPVDFNSRNKVGGISFPTTSVGYAWFSLNDYSEYHVYKTTDGGDNWASVFTTSGPGSISGNMFFFDANTGIIAGPKRWIIRTTNGGTSWDTITVKNVPSAITSGDCEEVCQIDANTAWIVGNRFMCKSTDKGATWNYVNHGLKNIDSAFYRVVFKDANNGCVSSNDDNSYSYFYRTTDGGTSWSIDSSIANKYRLYAMAYNSKGNFFMGSTNGYIFSDVKPVDVKNEREDNVIRNFVLSQNYPNPFNPSTKINFELKTKGHVTLKVFDIMGREIVTLVNDERPAGSYSVNFEAKNSSNKTALASGVYYYRLQIDNFTETKKMILVR